MITILDIQSTGIDLSNHGAIAEQLSTGKTKVGTVSREQFATWAAKTGMRATIEDCAATPGHPLRSIALALVDVLRSPTAGIDFSVADNVAMLQVWVSAGAVTQEQADNLLNLAIQPDPVSMMEVAQVVEAYLNGV